MGVVGRFLVYKPVQLGLELTGKIGAGGVVVGEGKGYFGKLYDGITAMPDIVTYFPRMLTDLERVQRIDEGFRQAASARDYAWGALKNFEFKKAWEGLRYAFDGLDKVTEVATEIDYNGLWNALNNAADNILRHPVETAAAAATVYAAGWTAARAARFWVTRGEGTVLDMAERRLGQKLFPEYHRRKAIRYLKREKATNAKPGDEPPQAQAEDPYAILGVGRTASGEEIDAAGKMQFERLSRAYDTLAGPKKMGVSDKDLGK
ncbi:MAG: J domain-containing protein [Candidatus Aenigmarchaeota archaeon]|nr:J domain-containing protein [Candidatus Aenigmarchaeota archaeon]